MFNSQILIQISLLTKGLGLIAQREWVRILTLNFACNFTREETLNTIPVPGCLLGTWQGKREARECVRNAGCSCKVDPDQL